MFFLLWYIFIITTTFTKNEIKPVDAELLDKPAGKYSITKKVKGTTEGQKTAGKYANNLKEPVRPDFQGIKTIYH